MPSEEDVIELSVIASPLDFLQAMLGPLPERQALEDSAAWWRNTGETISCGVDRSGTPHLRMFDRQGQRIDDVMMPGGYRDMLLQGYRSGLVWRAFSEESMPTSFLLGYLTAFYDPGLYCPYTVSLATAVPVFKYGTDTMKRDFLDPLLRSDETVWQGATWMTEIGGGSDLGANVETTAVRDGDIWLLSGDKYFASNVGAELAVVAARPKGAPDGVRGLALFLLPRRRRDGSLNYAIRRLKDKIGTRSVPTGEVELRNSEAWLLGDEAGGIYLILEVLNLSRTANSVGSVALAQRALAESCRFASGRIAFGRPIIDQPLLRRQFDDHLMELERNFALAWETVRLYARVWQQRPPYSEDYLLFRLLAHLAKFRTAEFAAQSAKWAMEVHGGIGTLAEFPVERLFREAMVLAIWEGTSHRQILDGMAVMKNRGAHKLLAKHCAGSEQADSLGRFVLELDRFLDQPDDELEAGAEDLFTELADRTAAALHRRQSTA